MRRKNFWLLFVPIVLLILVCGVSYFFVFEGVKKRTIETHLIKTGERDVKKLITSTQFVDFVTVLVSGDRENEYIEYQTYKVEAGFDLNSDKKTIRIINPPNELDRTILRKKLSTKKYDSYVKPVRNAYSLKACDIAVKYGILENAKKNINDSDYLLWGIDEKSICTAQSLRKDVNRLPCYFEIYGDILNEDVKDTLLRSLDLEYVSDDEKYSRDAGVFKIKGKGQNVEIRFGYTGKKFSKDTFESFRERLQTENENVTVFTYFDALDDYNSKQVLSYASDGYGVAYVLQEDGKLYYIDLALDGKPAEGQIVENLSSLVLYLAMSLQFDDSKEDISPDYIRYIEDYDKALECLRSRKYPEFKTYVDDMLQHKDDISSCNSEEKMLRNAANYFRDIKFEPMNVNSDFDLLMTNCIFLYNSHKSHKENGDYKNPEKRDDLLREINSSIKKNEQEVRANILTYFLQNRDEFGLSEYDKKLYLNELIQSAITVDKTIIESFDTDKERNQFYTKLFKNVTEQNKVEYETPELYSDMAFFFIGRTKDSVGGTGNLEKKLVGRNAGIPLGNVFVLVFSESDLPFLSSSENTKKTFLGKKLADFGKTIDNFTKTVHCLVFDDCSVRLFTCVDDDSIFEASFSIIDNVRKFLTQTHTVKIGNALVGSPEHIFFWDWRKMNIYKDGTAFLGYDYSNTSNYNVSSQKKFQKTERAKELRTIGEILSQFQNAYENDDYHYELAQDFVDRQLRNYIYDVLWRPSLM